MQRTYIQFFIVVVEEDKLRVGAGDVFHHQVVAEKVTAVKDKGDTCQAKFENRGDLVWKDTTEGCPRPRRLWPADRGHDQCFILTW